MTVLALGVLAAFALLDRYGAQIIGSVRAVRTAGGTMRTPRTDP